MNPNNTPSRQHRPNRWARLKKQLTQARAEAETAKRQRDWAHLFLASTDQWQEFSRWAQEQANNDADPSESAFTYFVNALTTAQAEADRATQRLTVAQRMGKMYEEQKEGYYRMMGTQGAQIDKLMSIVENLTERVMKQREEIQALKKTTAIQRYSRGKHRQPQHLHGLTAPTSTPVITDLVIPPDLHPTGGEKATKTQG